MNTKLKFVLVTLGVVLLVVTAGCGGDGGEQTPTQTIDPGVQTTVPDRAGVTNSSVSGLQVESVSFDSTDDTVSVTLQNTGDRTINMSVVDVTVRLETTSDAGGINQVDVSPSGSLGAGGSVSASTTLPVESVNVVGYTATVSCVSYLDPGTEYPYCPDSGIRYPE